MRLFVPLTRQEAEALASVARQEHRRPQDQAAAIIVRALSERGVLPLPPPLAVGTSAPDRENTDDRDG